MNAFQQFAEADPKIAAEGADVLVFVMPHAFIRGICKQIKDAVKKDAVGVTLITVRLFVPLDGLIYLFLWVWLFMVCLPYIGDLFI